MWLLHEDISIGRAVPLFTVNYPASSLLSVEAATSFFKKEKKNIKSRHAV